VAADHPSRFVDLFRFLFEVSTQRRKLNWNEDEYKEQLRRLDHARQHANLIIGTDNLSPAEVLKCALGFIRPKDQT